MTEGINKIDRKWSKSKSTCRKIKNLQNAFYSNLNLKAGKLKGSRAKGLTFERQIGRKVKRRVEQTVLLNPWVSFRDENGRGWAQPDIVIEFENHIVLIECKLTQTIKAWDQLCFLYTPLLEFIYKKPILRVQVCKRIKYKIKHEIDSLEELLTEDCGFDFNISWTLQCL